MSHLSREISHICCRSYTCAVLVLFVCVCFVCMPLCVIMVCESKQCFYLPACTQVLQQLHPRMHVRGMFDELYSAQGSGQGFVSTFEHRRLGASVENDLLLHSMCTRTHIPRILLGVMHTFTHSHTHTSTHTVLYLYHFVSTLEHRRLGAFVENDLLLKYAH